MLALRMREGLHDLVRTRLAGWLVREVFAYMSFAIPLKRLKETSSLLAFYHPDPGYPVHILIVPKRDYPSLLDVPAADNDFLRDLIETVQGLVRELSLEQAGYRLVVNGGSNQEIPVLHFHLISGSPYQK
jgi:histidine triad (HIT) family protein